MTRITCHYCRSRDVAYVGIDYDTDEGGDYLIDTYHCETCGQYYDLRAEDYETMRDEEDTHELSLVDLGDLPQSPPPTQAGNVQPMGSDAD